MAVGAAAMPRGLFAPNGKLARRWPLWTSAMIVIYFVLVAAFLTMLSGANKSVPWGAAARHFVGALLRGILLRIHVVLRAFRYQAPGPLR
jgi:hypothetical protein